MNETRDLERLLLENSGQTQEQLEESLGMAQPAIAGLLKALGMIQKEGKLRDMERRFFTWEKLQIAL